MTPALLHPDLLRQFPGGIAFVDIETNGGPAQRASITEIGIVQVDEDGVREWSALRCEVTELTGPELLLSGNIGGQRLVAALPPRTGAAAGADVTLAFDADMLHLFDAESGLRIEAA